MKDNYKIMLIDDDEDDRMLFELSVHTIGPSYTCIASENCRNAIENLKAGVNPNFIFLDLNMPDMHGFDCLQEIKLISDLANIPIIIYSTSGYCVDVDRARELGAAGYLKKPSDFDELCQKIEKIISHLSVGSADYYIDI
jgi:CheY-like chemotaxis protein